jgi:hypothetical protein
MQTFQTRKGSDQYSASLVGSKLSKKSFKLVGALSKQSNQFVNSSSANMLEMVKQSSAKAKPKRARTGNYPKKNAKKGKKASSKSNKLAA